MELNQESLKRLLRKNIFFRAFKRYMANHNLIRADAIAYSIVLSIIPLFTVLIKYAEVDQDTIRLYIAQFMAAYGIPDSAEIILVLDGILKRADAIAGVGTLFAIFGATNALRHLETSFNSIYQTKSRPLFYRFSLHISAIIIIPGITILLGSSVLYLFKSIEPPGFMSMSHTDQNIWIANNRGYLLKIQDSKITKIKLSEKITTGAPFRDIYFNTYTGRSGRSWEMNINTSQTRIHASDFLRLKKIVALNSNIYVISNNGIIFFSGDGGQTWDYNTINILSKNSTVQHPITEDLFMDPSGVVFLLTSTAKGSQLITLNNKEYSIISFQNIYKEIIYLETGTPHYPPGFYLAGSGIFSYSENGSYWSRAFEANYANRKPRINMIASNRENRIHFAGNHSALWFNEDGKNYYPDIRAENIYYQQSLHGIAFISPDEGILYGNNNLFRFTRDGGNTWLYPENKILSRFSFFSHELLEDRILIVGENETLLSLRNPKITDTLDSTGRPRVSFDIEILHKRSTALSFLYNILAYLIIFILFFVFFLLLYVLLPNAKVMLIPAVIGSAFTSTALLFFLIGIRLWWLFFAKSVSIYGIWAVVPIGMLILLILLQIILFGLELSCLIQKDHFNKPKEVA